MTRAEILAGLAAGRTLVVDRKDEPHLPWLLELAERGELRSECVEYDEQSSAIKFSANREAEAVTVYDLIQQLAKYPADREIVVARCNSKREMRIVSVYREDYKSTEILLMVDWKEPKP